MSYVLALFALESGVVLVSGSHCSGRLGVAFEYGKLDSTEMTISVGHIFYVAADSNSEVLLSLLLQNGESCPV